MAPGRVRCDVEATAPPGASITWGDVVLAQTPSFTAALRGRIGPRDATLRRPDAWRWALALVARTKGSGDVDARVRLVMCRPRDAGAPDAAPAPEGACEAREIAVTGRVVVGD